MGAVNAGGGPLTETRQLRKIAEGREAEMFAWEDGTILRLVRDPGAHGARPGMMRGRGEPPPGTSFALRALTLVGRSLLVALYLRSYRRVRPIDMSAVKRWEIPIAAARLREGIEEEVPRLLAL